MVVLKSLPLKVKQLVNDKVAYDDSSLIKWLESCAGTKRTDLDIVSTFDHILDRSRSEITHGVTNANNFISHFHCCNRLSDVLMCEMHQMFYLMKGVIIQPLHVNYHGIDKAIEGSILADLDTRGAQANEDDWTFNLVLLRFRVRTEGEPVALDPEEELYVHNTATREPVDHLACEFVPMEDFPWETAIENMRKIASNDSFKMPKGNLEKRLASMDKNDILPYMTRVETKRGDTYIYCWGVNEGLQRASSVTGVLSKAHNHQIGHRKVNLRLFALKKSYNTPPPPPQSELLRFSSQFSKETALNNQVISKPCLTSDIISVVVSSYDHIKSLDNFFDNFLLSKESVPTIVKVLLGKMKEFMNRHEHFFKDMELNLEKNMELNLEKNSGLLKIWSDLFRSCEATKSNLSTLYSRKKNRRKEFKDKIPRYLFLFIFGIFICYHHDKKFLQVFSNLSEILTEETSALIVSSALQFVQTYLPFKIRNRSEHKSRCTLSLFHLPIKDIVMTLDTFFGSNAKYSYSREDIVKILNGLFSCHSNLSSTEIEKELTLPDGPADGVIDENELLGTHPKNEETTLHFRRSKKSSDIDLSDDENSSDTDDENSSDMEKSQYNDDSSIDNDPYVETVENLVPVNASFIDIFLHKFLVHNLALDSARIQSCFERGNREYERKYGRSRRKKDKSTVYLNLAEESFPYLQFPHLMLDKLDDEDLNIPTKKCVEKSERLIDRDLSLILSNTLQGHCLITVSNDSDSGAKFPLTCKEFTSQLLLPDDSQRFFIKQSLYWIPLQLFFPFEIPVERRIVHITTGCSRDVRGLLALNNLLGLAWTGTRNVGRAKHQLSEDNLPLPIYFANMMTSVNTHDDSSEELNENPDLVDCGEYGFCNIHKAKNALCEKMSCEVIRLSEDPSIESSKRVLLDDRLIGVLAHKPCLGGGEARYISFRKIPGEQNSFLVFDSYKDTFIPTCGLEGLSSMFGTFDLYAVLERDKGIPHTYFELKEGNWDYLEKEDCPYSLGKDCRFVIACMIRNRFNTQTGIALTEVSPEGAQVYSQKNVSQQNEKEKGSNEMKEETTVKEKDKEGEKPAEIVTMMGKNANEKEGKNDQYGEKGAEGGQHKQHDKVVQDGANWTCEMMNADNKGKYAVEEKEEEAKKNIVQEDRKGKEEAKEKQMEKEEGGAQFTTGGNNEDEKNGNVIDEWEAGKTTTDHAEKEKYAMEEKEEDSKRKENELVIEESQGGGDPVIDIVTKKNATEHEEMKEENPQKKEKVIVEEASDEEEEQQIKPEQHMKEEQIKEDQEEEEERKEKEDEERKEENDDDGGDDDDKNKNANRKRKRGKETKKPRSEEGKRRTTEEKINESHGIMYKTVKKNVQDLKILCKEGEEEDKDEDENKNKNANRKRKRGKETEKPCSEEGKRRKKEEKINESHGIMYKMVKKTVQDLKILCKKDKTICKKVSSALQKILEEVQNRIEIDGEQISETGQNSENEETSVDEECRKGVLEMLRKMKDDAKYMIFPIPMGDKYYISASHGMKECDGKLAKNAPSIFPVDIHQGKQEIGHETIHGVNLKRLLPGRWLDDVCMNFWRAWLLIRMGTSAENIFIFTTHFYQKLSGLDGYSGVARWSKNVDIFTKDIIMIPINHSECHWSLYVIINPGKVGYQMSDNRGTDIEVKPPFCLYMDSYGYPNQFHDQILLYLNKEVERLKKLSSSEKNMPFTTESLPCYVPEIPQQNNQDDCGLYAMRYMLGILHLAKTPITFRKAQWENTEKRHRMIQIWLRKSGYFNFKPSNIVRFRHEVLTLIINLKGIYDKAPRDIEETPDSANDEALEVMTITSTT